MREQNQLSTDLSADGLVNTSRPPLMTVKDVAERLRLSPAKIYALTQSGELECYRFGRSVRVEESQLSAYLEGVKQSPHQFPEPVGRHF